MTQPQPIEAAPPRAAGAPSATELAVRGWASPLARWVTGGVLLEGITGLWTYAGPFSLTAQVLVLLHGLAGVLLLVPGLVYLWRHFRIWQAQTLTAVSVLGYAAGALLLTSLVTGTWLTLQAAAGTRCDETLALIHLVSGLAAFGVILIHLPMAWVRRRPAARARPALAREAGRFGGWIGVGLVLASGLAAAIRLSLPVPNARMPIPPDYAIADDVRAYTEYADSPFAPTFARTDDGTLIRPEVLSGSASCGTTGCHTEILAEWQPSAHRFAAMNPPFQKVQNNFAEERSAVETRYCAGCHDPISLFAGAKDPHAQALSAPGVNEGISCAACHSISHVDQRGNADYVVTPPTKYVWEGTRGLTKWLSDYVIRAYPRQHLADYDRNILRTPEFCGACHKQFIPEVLNRFGVSPGQNQYDEWRNSHWHSDDPGKDLSCRDCHMRLVRDSTDPGRGEAGDRRRTASDGAHRHHGTIATNVFMPEVLKLPGWKRHVALTRAWIRGETVLPEIADLWPSGPVASVQIIAPETVKPGSGFRARVLVTNQKVGHNFSTGPLDFIRAWLHVTVRDADGVVLGEWGSIDPKTRRIEDVPGQEHKVGNSRKQGTMVLEGMPLDEGGMPLVQHELWKKAGGHGQRVIFPGYSDAQTYELTVPRTAKGPLSIDAELNFRRYRQEFLDLAVPKMERASGVRQPTVVQAKAKATVRVKGDS